MDSVRKDLQQVWAALHRANIQDDLTIIEYIAWLLTQGEFWTIDLKERPQPPRYSYNPDNSQLRALLQDAAEQINNANPMQGIPQLVNKHVLFYASPTRQRDSYPTPRHIIDFMLDLIDVHPEHDFADFACGSGGFLIPLLPSRTSTTWPSARRTRSTAQQKPVRYGRRVGVDISPNWVHIANANIMLHTGNDTNAQIKEGDAQRLYGPDGPFANESFDRIAMSPPLVTAIGEERQLSDEIFTNLLLNKLNPNGRGVTLVSDYLLENSEHELRERLSRQLNAVITLVDGMPPFIQETTHILLVNKRQSASNKAIWFLNIEEDGYPADSERDLSEEPATSPEENDLLFAREVVKITGRERFFEESIFSVYKNIIADEKLLGIVIKAPKGYRMSIHLTKSSEYISLALEYTPVAHPKDIVTVQEIKLKGSDSAQQTSDTSMSEKIIIEHNGLSGRLIAITNDGRLLGTQEPISQLHLTKYNLLSSLYLGLLQPVSTSRKYSTTKRADKENHHQWTQHTIDDAIRESMTLRFQLPLDITPYLLLTALNSRQRKVWEFIQELTKNRPYFTADHLANHLKYNDIPVMLKLFTRLGLIVPVNLANHMTKHTLQCYRRTFQSELDTPEPSTETVK